MTLNYSHILVAVDGSKEAERAFKKSVGIAGRNDAILNLVYVIDNRSFGAIEAYDKVSEERARVFGSELLEGYKKQANEAGVQQVNALVEYGAPKTIIPGELAAKLDADLIICGATGINGAERIFMGSVSERIVRSAKCDVLVVRSEEVLES